MNAPPTPGCVIRLDPGGRGGIHRLFEHARAAARPGEPEVVDFETHGAMLTSLPLFPLRLARFDRLCRSGRFRLCHINLSAGGSTVRKLMFAAICRRHGLPYLLHLHSGRFPEFVAAAAPRTRRRIDSLFKGADRVLTLGTPWRRFVIDTFAVPPQRVLIVPNGVPGPEVIDHRRRERPPRILFLGMLAPEKGVDDLIEALASPALAGLAWTATIAGAGRRGAYRTRLADKGLAGRVNLSGWIDAAAVEELLRRSTILALPSHSENLPLSVLEGMAHGLCPVSTPVGAVGDVIEPGINGVLVPPRNPPALAEALARLVADPARCQTLARHARLTWESRYDIAVFNRRLAEIYRERLAAHAGAPRSP